MLLQSGPKITTYKKGRYNPSETHLFSAISRGSTCHPHLNNDGLGAHFVPFRKLTKHLKVGHAPKRKNHLPTTIFADGFR